MASNNYIYKMSNAGGLSNITRYVDMLAGNTTWVPWEPAGAYDALATVTVPSGGAASVTFAGIPAGYKHLQFRIVATTASSAGSISFRFNGDSSASYTYHRLIGNGSSASANGATTSGRTLATVISCSTTQPTPTIVDILDYGNSSKLKTLRSIGGYDYNGSGEVAIYSNLWTNTAAITSVDLIVEGGASYGQFSQFALYGIK